MDFRSQQSNSPAPGVGDWEPVKRGPGRPKGSRNSQARILKPVSPGPREECFAHVPVSLQNRVADVTAVFLTTVMSQLESAYAGGIEMKIVELMDVSLPDVALAFGRAMMEALAAQERGFHGSTIACHRCPGLLDYQGDVNKTLKTRIGNITPKRAYYHGSCGHSLSPLDAQLGVDGRHAVMPSLQDNVAWLAASMSYPETVKVLDKFCPSKFSLKAVQRITATVAEQVEKEQMKEAVVAFRNLMDTVDDDLQPGVAVLQADGGFVLVRDHTESSREFKLAVLGELPETVAPKHDARPGEVDEGIKLVKKTFVGHFADPDTLFSHMQTEYLRRGLHLRQTLHAVSDGAPWILPRMIDLVEAGQELSLVLDWWHADERVAQFCNILLGQATKEAAEFRELIRADLWHNRLDDFFLKLQQGVDDAKRPGDRKTLKEHQNYFVTRRHLLRYQECRDRGLPIGSGAIEGAIRFIGKDRLDRTGMRWKILGAEDILQLRCLKYSERWDELASSRATGRRHRYRNIQTAWNQAA